MGRRVGLFGLVNYRVHPANERYHIFSFNSLEEADLMAKELEDRNIWYERDEDEIKEGTIYLFGVDKNDFKKAMDANFAVSAAHRNPMIKNKFLRIFLVTMTITLVTIGIVGYVKSMQKLDEKTEQVTKE